MTGAGVVGQGKAPYAVRYGTVTPANRVAYGLRGTNAKESREPNAAAAKLYDRRRCGAVRCGRAKRELFVTGD